MSTFIPLGIVILSAVIYATFQLGLGALLLLYHASLGRHVRRRTRQLVSAFTIGFGTMTILLLASACFFIWAIFGGALPTWALSAGIAVLAGLAVIIWFLYYRRGHTTELWLPKPIARYIDRRAKSTDSNIEAFSLGLLACFGEFPFSFILIIIAASSIMEFTLPFRAPVVALFALIAILPLIIMRFTIRRGATVVDIQRWRVKHKFFLRTVSGLGFLTLAVFLLAFKLMIDIN